jgi:hypothetical protein
MKKDIFNLKKGEKMKTYIIAMIVASLVLIGGYLAFSNIMNNNDITSQPLDNCGNGLCEDNEIDTCPEDCGQPLRKSVCGNGVCEEDELGSCTDDCGQPPKEKASVCGNGICEADELGSCAEDCGKPKQEEEQEKQTSCGNGICEGNEIGVCKEDCG